MKSGILSIEEERANAIACIFGVLASAGAFVVVVGFLDGTLKDTVSLGLVAICLFIRFLEKKSGWFQRYAKYAYMTIPFWSTWVLVISNDGKYAAVTQAYFMWLILSVAYYEVSVVLFCSSVTIASTVGALILFPEAMLQLDNFTIWCYIFSVYLLATILAAIVASRMRSLLERTRQLKLYEDELFYLEQLEKKEEKHREFIHNLNHYLIAIGELAKEENCDQIINLMTELNLNLARDERMVYTARRAVNAILSEKAGEAAENQIDFDIYVEPGVLFGEATDGDLVAMLGNLLDNALEAARLCAGDMRKLSLRIYMEKEGKLCVVKIVNYFAVRPKRHQSGFVSTKKEKGAHGIGIKSVSHTARKYDGYFDCLVDDGSFTAILVLPVKN